MNAQLLETDAVRELFAENGISVAEWARERGFSTGLVYQVLEGRRKCLRGQSHKIAVELGLKRGKTMDLEELSRQLKAGHQPGGPSPQGGPQHA